MKFWEKVEKEKNNQRKNTALHHQTIKTTQIIKLCKMKILVKLLEYGMRRDDILNVLDIEDRIFRKYLEELGLKYENPKLQRKRDTNVFLIR